jgi:hypothetical protein
MFRVEIERADETIFYFGDAQEEGGTWFDSEWVADEIAEGIWGTYSHTDKFARISVVDDSGERMTDWEV